ncbi:hypothetical protein [Photobacterium lipolyticum]|uniref:Uncharacterized protein n=1 Tax=Photobacterium lipolyticum TaxID=266810 RepID=A0A2T3N0A1_9GAMM|nr:hypothetical protein [Photobacterium lipolyticum]PSW05658.1 hypothetical protein C9I89_07875 [Photobacterium lipolyticum]
MSINSLEDLACFAESRPFDGTGIFCFYQIRRSNTKQVSEIEALATAVEKEEYGMVGLVTADQIRDFQPVVTGGVQ